MFHQVCSVVKSTSTSTYWYQQTMTPLHDSQPPNSEGRSSIVCHLKLCLSILITSLTNPPPTSSKWFCGRSMRLVDATSCVPSITPFFHKYGQNIIQHISSSYMPSSLVVWVWCSFQSLCHPVQVISGWLTCLLTMSISFTASISSPHGPMLSHCFPTLQFLLNNLCDCRPTYIWGHESCL